ncbi:HlyD family efflux transporter periplasmic adaptor subunit [Actinoplanes sp. NPDC023714]|uniref:efflux RND transporter periplasmic adaptor subunit n=1 Tax=Actinoplanes sp. NPDC023714 TaxID=3154322 RepID=UPI0033C0708B
MSKVTGRSRANGRIRWIGAGIVLVGAVAAGVTLAVARDDEAATTARLVTVAADRGAVTLDVATTGTVEPATTRSLSFAVAGTVESIAVRAGNRVAEGDELARLDDVDAAEDVSDAQTKLAEAQARLTEARESAAMATASATVCAVETRTGGPVVAGRAAAEPMPAPKAAVPTTVAPAQAGGAQVGRAQAGRAQAGGAQAGRAQAGRAQAGGAAAGGAVAESPQPAEGARAVAGAAAAAALYGGRIAQAGDGIGPIADVAEAGAPMAQAEELQAAATAATVCATQGYPGSGNDQVLTAEQAVNNAELSLVKAREALDGTVIKAPIAGTVLTVGGSVGDQVKGGSTFVGLADTYDMQVSAEFPEADAGSLAKGQAGTVTLADSDASYEAKVVQVDPVGTSDGTLVRYGVLLAFTAAPEGLLVGQSAQVRVRTGEVAEVLRVPSTSVHDIAGESGTVRIAGGADRTVTVGLRGDQYTEITDGLAEGEQVVRSW